MNAFYLQRKKDNLSLVKESFRILYRELKLKYKFAAELEKVIHNMYTSLE